MKIAHSLLAACAAAVPAFGQSFNIEIERPGQGPGAGLPATTFGAAANQPGIWNSVTQVGQSYNLLNLSGRPSNTMLVTSGSGSPTSHSHGRATGDYAKLMEDGFVAPDDDVSLILNFGPLAEGRYFAYVYAGLRDYGQCCATHVVTSIFNHSYIGGYPVATNTFYDEITHTRDYFTMPPGGGYMSIFVSTNPAASGQGVVTGVQLQKLPERLYVNAAAAPGGNGRQWSTAFQELQPAIDLATEWNGRVEEIWVARGSYTPTRDTNRNASFSLMTGRANLYGGFAGHEVQLEERHIAANSTILSGNIGGPLPYDNSHHILQISDDPQSAVVKTSIVDGFTFLGGYGGMMDRGAALYCYGDQAVIRNCRFVSNTSEIGGAAYASDCRLTFADCVFQSNRATLSGGAFASSNSSPSSTTDTTFVNCRFLGNRADTYGGAVALLGGTTTFVNCAYSGNAAPMSGGALHVLYAGTTANLRNCTFAGNRTDGYGAAMHLDLGAHANLTNTILWDNLSGAQWSGVVRSQLGVDSSTWNANFCTAQFLAPGQWQGIQNDGRNPLFVNATGGDAYGNLNDDLRLALHSPLSDAGANTYVLPDLADLDGDGDRTEATPLDLARQARIVDDPNAIDTGMGFSPLVDRGAYERQNLPDAR